MAEHQTSLSWHNAIHTDTEAILLVVEAFRDVSAGLDLSLVNIPGDANKNCLCYILS